MTTQKDRPTPGEAVQDPEVANSFPKERPAANVPQLADLGVNEPSVDGFGPAEIDPYAPEANRVSGLDAKFRHGVVMVKEGRPRRHEFFRIHPDPEYCHDYWLLTIDDGKERENYIILKGLRHLVADDVHPHRLYVGMNRHDTVFVWPVRLYDDGTERPGPGKSWSDSAQSCADRARSLWLRIFGNRSSGAYEYVDAEDSWPEPVWPDYTFAELVRKAFGDRLVDSPDHPVLQKIRGAK